MASGGRSPSLCLVFTTVICFISLVMCERFNKMSDQVYASKGKGEEVVADVSERIASSGIFPPDFSFLCRIAWVESKYGTAPGIYRPGYFGGIWQVDRIGYIDTTTRPSLRKYYPRIKEVFGIEWTQTSWVDLVQPFDSGLAARLVLATIPYPIPRDLHGQAEQWKRYYNTKAGNGTVQKFIADVEQATGCAR